MVDFKITRKIAKIVRNELQYNIDQIANQIGCKPGTIAQLETGHWQPTSGKVHAYYKQQWFSISEEDKEKSARILGLLYKDPVPRKYKKAKMDIGYTNRNQYSMRFTGEMSRYLHDAAKYGMYENPGEYVRDLIRQDRLKRKMEEKYEAELAA